MFTSCMFTKHKLKGMKNCVLVVCCCVLYNVYAELGSMDTD